MHNTKRCFSRRKSNSLNPQLRYWKGCGGLYTRLNNKATYTMNCHHIIKTQDHVSFVYDKEETNLSDHTDEFDTFSVWSCLTCSCNNSHQTFKCQMCNTPSATHEMTLADYMPQNTYALDEEDDMIQAAIQLSYQTVRCDTKHTKRKRNRQMRGSFAVYWRELQHNKVQKKLFKKSCAQYMRDFTVISHVNTSKCQTFISHNVAN
eukprot:960849_1